MKARHICYLGSTAFVHVPQQLKHCLLSHKVPGSMHQTLIVTAAHPFNGQAWQLLGRIIADKRENSTGSDHL